MISEGKRSILGTLVDVIDYESAIARIANAAEKKSALAAGFMSVHAIVWAYHDSEYRARLNRFELVCPDGQPVRWGLNWLHDAGLQDRVSGPDLSWRMYAEAERRGLSIYFYGSQPESLEALKRRLDETHPGLKVAGMNPGLYRPISPTERTDILARITDSGADMLYCALGCPRQELFAYQNREPLSMPILCIGAALDFHAGIKRRAPGWMSRWGLEWAHRLSSEPKRLAGRYFKTNPTYLSLLAAQRLGGRRFPTELPEPRDEVFYG